MKKIYIIPTMDVVEIHAVRMLADSDVTLSERNRSGNAGDFGLSRTFSGDDDE